MQRFRFCNRLVTLDSTLLQILKLICMSIKDPNSWNLATSYLNNEGKVDNNIHFSPTYPQTSDQSATNLTWSLVTHQTRSAPLTSLNMSLNQVTPNKFSSQLNINIDVLFQRSVCNICSFYCVLICLTMLHKKIICLFHCPTDHSSVASEFLIFYLSN